MYEYWEETLVLYATGGGKKGRIMFNQKKNKMG